MERNGGRRLPGSERLHVSRQSHFEILAVDGGALHAEAHDDTGAREGKVLDEAPLRCHRLAPLPPVVRDTHAGDGLVDDEAAVGAVLPNCHVVRLQQVLVLELASTSADALKGNMLLGWRECV